MAAKITRQERDCIADKRVKYFQFFGSRIAFRFSLNFVWMFEIEKKSFHFVSFESNEAKINLQKMLNIRI